VVRMTAPAYAVIALCEAVADAQSFGRQVEQRVGCRKRPALL
jgi:hypothetical protein